MKNATLIAAALVCAYLLTTGIATAQVNTPERGYVAGFSPNFVDPLPDNHKADPAPTLTADANRLIRWRGWLDVDAFSHSVLQQMQMQLENGIELGKFTLAEESIVDAVAEAAKKVVGFAVNPNLNGDGETLRDAKLFVWTYRHNHTDTGLYQLYISVKGNMLIGTGRGDVVIPVPHKDIQSLRYEFGPNASDKKGTHGEIVVPVEIWRGAVVRVNARGAIEVVGNEAGVVTLDGSAVERVPISAMERAPSLEGNPTYDPKAATGAEYTTPLDRNVKIDSNSVQKRAGDANVKTVPVETRTPIAPFRFRSR